MKQFLALLTSLLFCTFPMSATTFVPDGDEGDPEEIDLRNQNYGEAPTSISATYVSAFKTDGYITIYVNGYFGYVDVSILGIGGSLSSFQNWINGSGVIVLNSSSLPFGIYTLNIMTNQLYQGVFTI